MLSGTNMNELAELIEEFLTGARPEPISNRVLATVLFTDIVGSTERASALGDRDWRELLDRHDAIVREQLVAFKGREVSTTGDGFFATFDGPARAIDCAKAIISNATAVGLEVRTGVHTGECEVRDDNYAGIAVHIGARVSALAGAGETLTTRTVKDLVAGSGIEFADLGLTALKGIAEPWQLYRVV
jgi:class 3 adenylate cyclase